jgi:hypothetical protein
LDDRKVGAVLPSRVVEVGLAADPRARLIETNGLRGDYCALSYCWAPRSPRDNQNTLLQTTIEQFKESLPLDALPKPILEAIEVTRRIGVPYLWVDRLCILQDDRVDQQNECDRMCDIYERALLTLAALGDDTGEKGLFLDREVLDHPDTEATGRVKLSCALKGKHLGEVYVARALSTEEGPNNSGGSCFEQELLESRWITRGWILQERILSRRIVYFGKRQLYWECQRNFWNEDGGPNRPNDIHVETTGVLKRNFVENLMFDGFGEKFGDKTDVHEHWMDVVVHYSGRKLTVPDDILRAISGIAEALRRRLSLKDFHFGLWMDFLSEELSWYSAGTLKKPGTPNPRGKCVHARNP